MKLATLRKRAARTTAARGHRMQWRAPFGRAGGPLSQFGQCRHCGKEVLLCERPAPNGIDAGGEALALNCHAEAIARQVRHRRETVTDLRTLRTLERAGWIREAEPGDWQKGRRYVDPIDEGTRPRHGKYWLAYRDGCLFPYVIRPA